MNRRFLSYYERELRHFREMGAEFAAQNPKIAGRLGLDEFECADPYVERLVESMAFMAARVQLKIDAEFPRFTQHLLETIFPQYLAPTPSMAVVRFDPAPDDASLAEGYALPRQTCLRSMLGPGDQTACEYSTAHDVTLWPLQIAEAAYHSQDLLSLHLPSEVAGAKAAIRLRLRCTAGLTFDQLALDSLPIYIRGGESRPMRLYEQLLAHGMGVVVRSAQGPVKTQARLPAAHIRRWGFEESQALLPRSPRTFEGYRLLREYFAFPDRFMFVELAGLGPALQQCGQVGEVDLIVPLRQIDLELEGDIEASNFALFCTPAVNLFPKRADRIHLSDSFSEFHVVPDRTRPLDFEVFQVETVTGYGVGQDEETRFRPFYDAHDLDPGAAGGAYFAVNRLPRTRSAKEKRVGPRSQYAGSEVYLSLVDARSAPYRSGLRQLAVTTLCTNRDLPMQMPVGQGTTDFTIDGGGPVASVRCVSGPTPPKPSYAEGEFAWRIISHLSLNYLSLADSDEKQGAVALRELLKLYVQLGAGAGQRQAADPMLRQVEGVRSVRTSPIIRRFQGPGPISFARGLEVALTLDETTFEGTGVFLLGAVLEQFFAQYVSMNSFTETVVRTVHRGEVMRWPTRLGRQPSF